MNAVGHSDREFILKFLYHSILYRQYFQRHNECRVHTSVVYTHVLLLGIEINRTLFMHNMINDVLKLFICPIPFNLNCVHTAKATKNEGNKK